jgi:hypothetical protein
MLQVRLIPIGEEGRDMEEHGVLLELAIDPARLLFTLNACRLLMPENTDPIHTANWHQIEVLVRQLAIIYKQTQPHRLASGSPRSGPRVKRQWHRSHKHQGSTN